MKQSGVRVWLIMTAFFCFSFASAQSSVVAPAGSTFVPDPNADVGVTARAADSAVSSSSAIENNQLIQGTQVQQAYQQMNVDTSAYNALMAQQAAALAAQQAADAAAAAKKQQQNAATMQALAGACPAAINALFGGSNAKSMSNTANNVNDALFSSMSTPSYYPGLDHSVAGSIGMDANAKFASGCNNFIDKDGKLGQWGQWALSQIKSKPSFGDKVPTDIDQWCPKYSSMSKEQRDIYWVWILSSMASSESSCVPTNDNPNAPNGTAIGLFQLEYNKCPKATGRDLHSPEVNITCAVDLLGNEMEKRTALMTPTSKGSQGTYWGPLRNDDWNTARGGDISGAMKTRKLMSEYRFCH